MPYAIEKNEYYTPKFSYATRNQLYPYFSINPKFETFKNELKERLKEIGI